MELPIAPQSYLPSSEALVRALSRARAIFGRTAAVEAEVSGATVFTNADRPGVRCANFAIDVRDWAPIAEHFREAGVGCHEVFGRDGDWLPETAAALEEAGYHRRHRRVYLLSEIKPARRRAADAVQIIPARAVYPLARAYYVQRFIEQEGADPQLAGAIADAMIDHLDEPRLELYVARSDGRVAGSSGTLTLGQVGVLDNTFLLSNFRGRGLGKTLLAHTLEYCQRAQFEQVVVELPEGCPATPLYESMGFRHAASFVKYARPRG